MIPNNNSFELIIKNNGLADQTAPTEQVDYRVPECCGRKMVTLTPFDIELLVGYYCPQCNKFEPGENPKIKKFLV